MADTYLTTTDPNPIPSEADEQDLATKINACYAKTLDHFGKGVQAAIECGGYLNAAKERERHGNFGPWLKANCAISERRAQEFMAMDRHLKQMPDFHPKLAGLTLKAAQKLINTQWQAKGRQKLKSVIDCEKVIADGINQAQHALCDLKEMLGEDAWREWLASWNIPQAIAAVWIKVGPPYHFGTKKDPDGGFEGRKVPPFLFPDPAVRRLEEESIAIAQIVGEEPVEIRDERGFDPGEEAATDEYTATEENAATADEGVILPETNKV
jgi:hypothetical protein